MFSLDSSKNDTSVTLNFIRAGAAQMVCVGHAVNLSGGGYTYLPNVGVMLFFILSGFVIAHTLSTKSASEDYGIAAFGIERFARIYVAFFPAIIIIAVADHVMEFLGLPLPGGPNDLNTLFGNLIMRQGHPSDWSVTTFGSAGHLKSIALELHIYFFVGAIFFLLKGRNVIGCAIVALMFSRFPLAYVASDHSTDHSLFVTWLAGFAGYYVVRSMNPQREHTVLFSGAFVMAVWYWARHRTFLNDYELSNLAPFAIGFFALVIVTQGLRTIPASMARAINFAADYSFSLFLLNMTVIKIVMTAPITSPISKAILAVLLTNVLAIGFAVAFEHHYRWFADRLKASLGVTQTLVRVRAQL